MSQFLVLIVLLLAFVSAWFIRVPGVYKCTKQLSAFEIFHIAFTPGRSIEVIDVAIGWPLPEHIKSGLESYLRMIPMDEPSCVTLWNSWKKSYKH